MCEHVYNIFKLKDVNDVEPVFNGAHSEITISSDRTSGEKLYHFDVVDLDFEDNVELSIKGTSFLHLFH